MAKEYIIPHNFNKSGYVLNGMIETRKAVEAGCGAVIGFLICQILPLKNPVWSIIIHILLIGLLGVIGFIGVRGDPTSVFLRNYWRWRKIRKKPFIYNPNGEAFVGSPTELIFEERDAGDIIADALDAFKEKFKPEKPEYVEGKTFMFAADPTLARLRDLSEQRDERKAAEELEAQINATPADPDNINIDDMVGSLAEPSQEKVGE